jgi:hypothetical protein
MIFDFFKKRDYSNVVQLPEKVPYPYVEPPTREVAPEAMYSIGPTSECTHMIFKMGYSTLTMTKQGCQDLIDQLEFFKNQLKDEE